MFVTGYFPRLMQCVGNVLVNAITYTEAGGETSVRTRSDEANASVELSDHSTGISPQLLPRVFDLFAQSARTQDRTQGGLGKGLAVVKRLVEMLDGEVCARLRRDSTITGSSHPIWPNLSARQWRSEGFAPAEGL